MGDDSQYGSVKGEREKGKSEIQTFSQTTREMKISYPNHIEMTPDSCTDAINRVSSIATVAIFLVDAIFFPQSGYQNSKNMKFLAHTWEMLYLLQKLVVHN